MLAENARGVMLVPVKLELSSAEDRRTKACQYRLYALARMPHLRLFARLHSNGLVGCRSTKHTHIIPVHLDEDLISLGFHGLLHALHIAPRRFSTV
jgi:hypothetical protein